MTKYCTVVFKIEDDPTWTLIYNNTIKPMFGAENVAVSVSAVSLTDEITKLNCIEHIMENREYDTYDKVDTVLELIASEDPLTWWKDNVNEG